ncbi:hypothetical protein MALH07_00397 [Mycoplasma anatis]|uniref:hypothetical protein n=1 Tax=Mycoplasmopsis anatis TaxID=171279 RepID=UPI001C4EA70F|nr:hypothetical protein [Mycoplasmopsis anatis]MBW0599022.1 hypothetical protein [Mycoplasmopsis anatis]MBW0601281.1 hypothetical protein [Mycoplasmopsis anatis]
MEISQKVQKIQKSKIILFQLIIIFEFIITILIYLIGKITNFSASYTQLLLLLLLFGFAIFVITSTYLYVIKFFNMRIFKISKNINFDEFKITLLNESYSWDNYSKNADLFNLLKHGKQFLKYQNLAIISVITMVSFALLSSTSVMTAFHYYNQDFKLVIIHMSAAILSISITILTFISFVIYQRKFKLLVKDSFNHYFSTNND